MHKLIFAALLLGAISLNTARADDAIKPLDLKFTAVDGKTVDFAKLRGKVVLLDFWATWCPSCVEEVPNVVATYKKYHAQGFEVVGISLDQDKDKMLEFAGNHDMTWPQYFDGQGWNNAISSSFGVDRIPVMVLIGKDGLPVRSNGHGLDEAVEQAIKGPTK